MTAEVIVDIAHSEVDKIFEYNCPFEVTEGSRVKVPFGGRVIDGIVIKIKDNSDFDKSKIKDIISVTDSESAITRECLFLADEIQKRYFVTAAAVLRLFLPSEMRKGKVRELYLHIAELNNDMSYEEILNSIGKAAKSQKAAAEYLKENGGTDTIELNKSFGRSAIKALEDKGFINITKLRKNRSPYNKDTSVFQAKNLTNSQNTVIESIEKSQKQVQLIHGVTGSGKTEIYLTLISNALEKGKSAIFLVPEISLTPQMLFELRSRFGEYAAILHSGLSAGERFDEWWRLRSGEAKIAIGARSAIFAPLENLGLIVIDEEHDGSYFSETNPRYSTLEIAKMRTKYNNCKLILGSATPSVESYLKAKEGEYNLLILPERINKKPMPEIIIADMKIEAKRGNSSAFSMQLRGELEKTISSNNQAIIFLNRRGYAQHIVCQDCGYIARCEDCDVTLTYHSEENELKCHFCGKRYKMLTACPECGGNRIRYAGTGTEKVVSELKKLFPKARIIRMDNDTTAGKEGHYKILKEFADKKADILVGTQMIAKGHNFPSVTLVGILDADMSLLFSDYRSRERTFQLLTQVAGRSGRADEKGVVVLQTYSPDHEVITYATSYNYKAFFEREIALRKASSFPPYSVVLRVMVVSEDRAKAVETLKKLFPKLEEIYINNKENFMFFNKMNCPIKRLQGKHRFQVLMRFTNEKLTEKIYSISNSHTSKDVLVYVEENPNNLS